MIAGEEKKSLFWEGKAADGVLQRRLRENQRERGAGSRKHEKVLNRGVESLKMRKNRVS